jgi:hypothetical protein
MREIYRSLRVEQVEGAAELLREAGIATSIQNGRSYKGARPRGFSYRDSLDSPKASILYVTHKGDLPEARRLMREAGLIDAGQRESYLSPQLKFALAKPEKKGFNVERMRTILLVLIVATIAGFSFFGPSLYD